MKLVILIMLFSSLSYGAELEAFKRIDGKPGLAFESPRTCKGKTFLVRQQLCTSTREDGTGGARGRSRVARFSILARLKSREIPLFSGEFSEIYAVVWHASEAVSACPDILLLLHDPYIGRGSKKAVIRFRYMNENYVRVDK